MLRLSPKTSKRMRLSSRPRHGERSGQVGTIGLAHWPIGPVVSRNLTRRAKLPNFVQKMKDGSHVHRRSLRMLQQCFFLCSKGMFHEVLFIVNFIFLCENA